MKNQPTPKKISRADVVRVAARDFSQTELANILVVLDRYGPADWHYERDRVHLAALKLSNGDISELTKWINRACCQDSTGYYDARDVLMNAEYPGDAKNEDVGCAPRKQSKIYRSDWRQYQKWLNKS